MERAPACRPTDVTIRPSSYGPGGVAPLATADEALLDEFTEPSCSGEDCLRLVHMPAAERSARELAQGSTCLLTRLARDHQENGA